jgi:co-chaperonin GroES (HSP10)
MIEPTERVPLTNHFAESLAMGIVTTKTTDATNGSGIKKLYDFHVLVKPDDVAEVTAGGVALTEASRDAERRAVVRGIIVAIAPGAFNYHDFTEEQLPKIGDRVIISKYVGSRIEGKHTHDGRDYMIINDKDVLGVID